MEFLGFSGFGLFWFVADHVASHVVSVVISGFPEDHSLVSRHPFIFRFRTVRIDLFVSKGQRAVTNNTFSFKSITSFLVICCLTPMMTMTTMTTMKRQRSFEMSFSFSRSGRLYFKRSLALCLWLLLTLSTASDSFQPTSAPSKLPQQKQQQQQQQLDREDKGSSSALHIASAASLRGDSSSPANWGVYENNHHSRLQQQQQQQQQYYQQQKQHPQLSEYEIRKQEWANRYTNLESLRETFGRNRNKLWGDLDAATTRRLYKTLLPKALLELVKMGVHPEDLAPLAYQARVAAKLYARERCQVPARIGATLFDGFRQLQRYGKFQTCGMSYDQIWEKYTKVILEELSEDSSLQEGLTTEDVTAKICLKILERSCTTNEHVDRWVLSSDDIGLEDMPHRTEDLQAIVQTLEMDVRRLLDPITSSSSDDSSITASAAEENKDSSRTNRFIQQYRILRLIARARQRTTGTRPSMERP